MHCLSFRMRIHPLPAAILLCLFLLAPSLTGRAIAAPSPGDAGARETSAVSVEAAGEPKPGASVEGGDSGDATPEGGGGSGYRATYFPLGNLYAPYLADPQSLRLAMKWVAVTEVEIQDSGSPRWNVKVGGSFGVVRWQPAGGPERGWQVGIDAGFNGQFDVEESYDVIGWDGILGLPVTAAFDHGLSLKVGPRHVSSHVGDEYMERTGRRRIEYTREELMAALSWEFQEHWRVYGEAGWGFTLRNEDLQEPLRVQAGLERSSIGTLWSGRAGWYAAADASVMQERDGQIDLSLEAGLIFASGVRRWRLGVQYYDGRVPLGEFFQDDEKYLALGLWLDL
jgi:hypothetical protein